jgi:predicted peroxiredoxin
LRRQPAYRRLEAVDQLLTSGVKLFFCEEAHAVELLEN